MEHILRPGIRQPIGSVPQQDNAAENTVSVVVGGGRAAWGLAFYARLGNLITYVGGVRVFGNKRHRLAAVVSIPGARQFYVEGQPLAPDDVPLSVHFEGIEARGGPWGVHAIPGVSLPAFRSYRTVSGVAGVVNITGEILGWTAAATAPGATVVMTGANIFFGPVPVPTNGSVSGDGQRLVTPNSTWSFTGTSAYMVEYVPPWGEQDSDA